MPSLFVIRGNDQGTRFELSGERSLLGRDASSRIQLHDGEVSRHHAELRRVEDGAYVVVDLKSSNGTFVNEVRIQERPLVTGDRIQVGGTLLLYTGAPEEGDNLAERIRIVPDQEDDDNSRIVHALSHEEGSRMFRATAAAGESPWLARARSNLQVMYRTALAVSHTLDIDQLLQRILQLIFEWVEADHGCVLLVDQESKQLAPKAYLSRRGGAAGEPITVSQTILNYVMEHKEGVLTSDAGDDARWNPAASILQLGIREAMCVPMQGRYDIVGVIHIDTTSKLKHAARPDRALGATDKPPVENKFTEEHLKLMIAIAHQAALAVEDTRYYSAMVQAERLAAVGQTVAMLSHDIKNILQRLRGGSFLIQDGLAREDAHMIKKGWELIERGQQRISNLVLDMLSFSKEREPEMEPGDLNQLVQEVVTLSAPPAEERGVKLTFSPAADLPPVAFDDEQLHRAVLNVVSNAIDACEGVEGGRVEVAIEADFSRSRVRIRVHDNGSGIAPEDLPKIFTLFMSRKRSRGTGLGLPVSQKILREHGGEIQVASSPGEGSCFTLDLPLAPPPAGGAGKTGLHEPP